MSRHPQTPLFTSRLPFELTVSNTDIAASSLAPDKWLDDSIRESLATADIVFVPWVGFREVEKPVFPTNTADLFRFIQEHAPENIRSEVAATDAEYTEVSLHADQIWLPDIWLKTGTLIILPVLVNLISEWIKIRCMNQEKKADATLKIYLQEPNGSTKFIQYTGPADGLAQISALVTEKDKTLVLAEPPKSPPLSE